MAAGATEGRGQPGATATRRAGLRGQLRAERAIRARPRAHRARAAPSPHGLSSLSCPPDRSCGSTGRRRGWAGTLEAEGRQRVSSSPSAARSALRLCRYSSAGPSSKGKREEEEGAGGHAHRCSALRAERSVPRRFARLPVRPGARIAPRPRSAPRSRSRGGARRV